MKKLLIILIENGDAENYIEQQDTDFVSNGGIEKNKKLDEGQCAAEDIVYITGM